MTTPRRARMIADRHLRDAAREIVRADVRNLRADLEARSISDRAIDRVAEGASEVYEEAIEVAADNKGALAAILAALVIWFARNPIMEAFRLKGDEPEQDADRDRSFW